MPSEFLDVQAYNNIVHAAITKERLLDAPVIAALGEDLFKLVDRHPRISLIVDLSAVGYLSSAFIGKLIALFKHVTLCKGRLCIAGANPTLQPLFKATGLDKILQFQPDAQTAIGLYKRKPL